MAAIFRNNVNRFIFCILTSDLVFIFFFHSFYEFIIYSCETNKKPASNKKAAFRNMGKNIQISIHQKKDYKYRFFSGISRKKDTYCIF